MATTFYGLYNLPQELTDRVFDAVAADDDVIFDGATQDAQSTSDLLTVSRRVAADYRKALNRRKNKFRKQHIVVDFDLEDKGSRAQFAPVELHLPACAISLHLIIKIDKSKTTAHYPPYSADEVIPDLITPLKTAVEALDLENLLIEVQIIDIPNDCWSHTSKWETRELYGRILSDIRKLDWKGNNNVQLTRIRSAIIGHHHAGRLATPAPYMPNILHETMFFQSDGWPTPRAQALLDIFRASRCIKEAIRKGPNLNPYLTMQPTSGIHLLEEHEYKYRGFDAIDL